MLWIVLVSGCGRLGFGDSPTSDGAVADSLIDTTATTDAACVPGAWSTAVPITGNFSYLSYDPSERSDRLELFLTGSPTSGYDVLVTTRASTSDLYPEAVEIPGLNSSTTDDANPAIAENGLALYFTSDRSGQRQPYVAKRTSLTTPFGAPILVPGLEDQAIDSIDVTPNGLAMYLSHTNIDLTVARRTSTSAPFDPPVSVNDEPVPYPSISTDELEVYASAGTTIDVRTRGAITVPFGAPTTIDFGVAAGDPDVSVDGRRILMSGPANIYEAQRSCE